MTNRECQCGTAVGADLLQLSVAFQKATYPVRVERHRELHLLTTRLDTPISRFCLEYFAM